MREEASVSSWLSVVSVIAYFSDMHDKVICGRVDVVVISGVM